MPDVDIRQAVVYFLAIVISITWHEFAHAFTADRLGDDTPRRHGRVSLNPVVLFRAHPFGALLVPLIGAFTGFLAGWAATPVNPARVRRDMTVRTADILITAAGPISNILLAIVSVGLFAGAFGLMAGGQVWAEPLVQLTAALVMANVFLAVFNLMPIPPLDGFGIIKAYTNGGGAVVRFLEQYSFLILMVFVIKGYVVFGPVMQGVGQVLSAVRSMVAA